MELIILGSGGCSVIPKPLCDCAICREARERGVPFSRTGPSAFISDVHLLIDTPAEVSLQLNRERISKVDHLLLTHLDPDHVEGLRVVEQIALDFRTWRAYPEKSVRLLLPSGLEKRIRNLCTAYGPQIDFYVEQGFLKIAPFEQRTRIDGVEISAVPVDRGDQLVYVYVFENQDRKLVYAPCDIKPFPEDSGRLQAPNVLVVQPGIFESGLKHGFTYSPDHVSRTTLYTIEETLALAKRIQAEQVVFVHLEEYWNRSHTDYKRLETTFDNAVFAHDGMRIEW